MQFTRRVDEVHAIDSIETGFRQIARPEAFDHAKLGRVGLDIMYLKL